MFSASFSNNSIVYGDILLDDCLFNVTMNVTNSIPLHFWYLLKKSGRTLAVAPAGRRKACPYLKLLRCYHSSLKVGWKNCCFYAKLESVKVAFFDNCPTTGQAPPLARFVPDLIGQLTVWSWPFCFWSKLTTSQS
jgi:hypothetical protein